ncbi:MAG: hypothetical protein QXE01_02925 [Sulfolobales archaeon]
MSWSWPSYPEGYAYPNEFVEPIIWKPVIVGYTLLIAIASGLAIITSLAVILRHKPLLRYVPLMNILGVSAYLVLLLGPLADLRRPDHAIQIFLSPHILPTSSTPGIAPIAIFALLWPVTFIVFSLTTLLILSGDLYSKGGLRRLLALGLKSEADYEKYYGVARIAAVLLLILGLVWAMYFPGLLFTAEAKLQLYNIYPLLPITYLLGSLIAAIFITSIASALIRIPLSTSLATILAASAFASIAVKLIEYFRISVMLSGMPVVSSLINVSEPLIAISIALLVSSMIIALYSMKKASTLPLASAIGFLAVIIDRWIYAVTIQQVSKTGFAIFPAHIDLVEELPIISLFALFIGIAFIISLILPLRSVVLEKLGGGGYE